jgi:hypothetical protein
MPPIIINLFRTQIFIYYGVMDYTQFPFVLEVILHYHLFDHGYLINFFHENPHFMSYLFLLDSVIVKII